MSIEMFLLYVQVENNETDNGLQPHLSDNCALTHQEYDDVWLRARLALDVEHNYYNV